MAVLATRSLLAVPRGTAARGRREIVRKRHSPYPHGGPLIVHCSHHKTGTVWIFNVLRVVAQRHGLHVFEPHKGPAAMVDHHVDVVLYEGRSTVDRGCLGDRIVRGSHMVRDPRDVAVSSYYYHLRGAEGWTQVPLDRFGGRTYYEVLQSLSTCDGMLTEIRRLGTYTYPGMAAWDYHQGDFYEMRYEDLWEDEAAGFRSLFRFYGFSPPVVDESVEVALRLSTRARSGPSKMAHVRSGRPGEWREHLEPVHLAAIEEVAPGLVAGLGYAAELGPAAAEPAAHPDRTKRS
jgi:hypothetical protein